MRQIYKRQTQMQPDTAELPGINSCDGEAEGVRVGTAAPGYRATSICMSHSRTSTTSHGSSSWGTIQMP